jgi:WD40 repeat protein
VGWLVTFIPSKAGIDELRVRVDGGPQEVLTGWFSMPLPPKTERASIEVRYLVNGEMRGPQVFEFDAASAYAKNTRQMLSLIKYQWLTWNQDKLWFATMASYGCGLQRVEYGVDVDEPDREWQLPPCKGPGMRLDMDLGVPVDKTARWAVARLTYLDGTQTDIVRFDRPADSIEYGRKAAQALQAEVEVETVPGASLASKRVGTGHKGPIHGIAASPNGDRMVTGSDDGSVRVWGVGTSDPPVSVATLAGSGAPVRIADIDRAGRRAAIGSDDGSVELFELDDPQGSRLALSGHDGAIVGLEFLADQWLISSSADQTARIWDLGGVDPAHDPVVLPHGGPVVASSVSGDSRWLVTAAENEAVFWDVSTPRASFEQTRVGGHERGITAVVAGRLGRWAATGSVDGDVILRDLSTAHKVGTKLRGHGSRLRALAMSPSGGALATGDDRGRVRVWNVDQDFPDEGSQELLGHTGPVLALAWAAHSETLASASEDGTVQIWRVADGKVSDHALVLHGHTGPVRAVVFPTRAPRIAASVGDDHTLRVWTLAPRE